MTRYFSQFMPEARPSIGLCFVGFVPFNSGIGTAFNVYTRNAKIVDAIKVSETHYGVGIIRDGIRYALNLTPSSHGYSLLGVVGSERPDRIIDEFISTTGVEELEVSGDLLAADVKEWIETLRES